MAYDPNNPLLGYDPAAVFGTKPSQLPLPNPQVAISAATPLYQSLIGGASQDILNSINGILPQPYQNAVLNQANARALAGGVGGSGFARAGQDLSLAREAMVQQNLGLNQLSH